MIRLFFLLLPILLTLAAPVSLRAQILYGTESEEAPARRSTSPGTLLGGPTLLANPSASGATDDDSSSSSTTGGLDSLGNYSSFSNRYRYGRRGMTRADIVRRQQEEAWKRNDIRDAEIHKLMLEFKVKESLQELFDESDRYVPQLLRKTEANAPTVKTDKTPPKEPLPSPMPADAGVQHPSTGASEEESASTEDERIDKELKDRLAAIEDLQDEEEKEKQRKAIQTRIDRRKEYLERRAEAERGADFFQIPPPLRLREPQLREGWCNLFDGRTFFGWRTQQTGPYGGGRFSIARGEIRSDPYYPGLLYTTCQFGDMTVSFEFQAEDDAEAFLLLRTSPSPRDLMSSCYAVVLNSADYRRPRGSVLGRHQISVEHVKEQAETGSKPETTGAAPRRWHKLTAQFDGTRLLIMLDTDEPITIYDANPLGYGYIGLLVAKGDVRFRNMLWQPGSSLSLFDGLDLEAHWRYRQDALKLTATRELSMQVTGGPGVIETKNEYDNFILQLEYNIAYTSARSGIFFRARPREEQTGYEVSLQNFPTRKDRDSTVGTDAGAFRNRKNARYTRPGDQKWNSLTLVAVDRQFQTWINGVPVCETSDRRPEAPGSKDGPFLNPGTIQILAPDANAYFQVRNIRITPIAPRSTKPRTFSDREQSTWENLIQERRDREQELRKDEKMRTGAP